MKSGNDYRTHNLLSHLVRGGKMKYSKIKMLIMTRMRSKVSAGMYTFIGGSNENYSPAFTFLLKGLDLPTGKLQN